jgi:hypothetical protein
MCRKAAPPIFHMSPLLYEEERLPRRPRNRWEDNIKRALKELGYEGMD